MAPPPGSGLPSAVQTALLLRDPVGFFERSRREHGPVFSARFLGMPPVAYVGTPELAEVVLRTDRDVGEAGSARRPLLEPLVGPDSVLCLDGEPWMRERRRLSPAFHGHRIAAWGETVGAIAVAELATWPAGHPMAMRPRMQSITLEVMMGVVFGLGSAAGDEAGSPDRRDRLRGVLRELVEVGSTPALAFVPPRMAQWLEGAPLAGRIPSNPLARFLRLKAVADALLVDEVRERRRRDELGADVLGMLAAIPDMPESQVRDELITLLEAGHETTATALSWCFERLVRHPDVLRRAQEAADRGDDDYLDAVAKETLRVRPILNDAPRRLTSPMAVGGHDVPAGWYVAPALPLVHTDPGTYADPRAFRPERFLDHEVPSGAWIPFGGSRRLCLGIQLALLEMRVVLGEVLRGFDLHAAGSGEERARLSGVTLVPEHGARVIVTQRGHVR